MQNFKLFLCFCSIVLNCHWRAYCNYLKTQTTDPSKTWEISELRFTDCLAGCGRRMSRLTWKRQLIPLPPLYPLCFLIILFVVRFLSFFNILVSCFLYPKFLDFSLLWNKRRPSTNIEHSYSAQKKVLSRNYIHQIDI